MPLSQQDGYVEVGCQGWNYPDWVTGPAAGRRAVFYPRGTRAAAMLEIYARAFATVEVDSTFYAIPSVSTIEGWNKKTPPGFTFSLKLPQEITHGRALRGESASAMLAEFCARVRGLGDKLAAILVQLPPQFDATPEHRRALSEFLPQLPPDLRFSIEFRHRSWFAEEEAVGAILKRHNVSLALVEGPWIDRERMWRAIDRQTAPFAYVRWMGARDLTRFDAVARAQDDNLRVWSERIKGPSRRGLTVYAYFSNYYEGHAPASANKLKSLLGQPTSEPDDLEHQPSLF